MLAHLVLEDMCSEVVVRVHSSAPYKTATSRQTQALASPTQMLPSHIPHHRDDQCPPLSTAVQFLFEVTPNQHPSCYSVRRAPGCDKEESSKRNKI